MKKSTKTMIWRTVKVSVGGRPVVDVDTMTIASGQCIRLAGSNGSGKTTLLKVIAGLLKPDNGSVEMEGQLLEWVEAKKILHNKVVYLHQQPYLFDTTVTKNIEYGLRQQGVKGEALRSQVAEALEWAQLTHLADRHARQLSGGESQRVALTRGRVVHPEVLLLDEPTSGMDAESRNKTFELVHRLREQGMAMILTSHELTEEAGLSDMTYEIVGGKLRSI
ncbi:MAG: energy-coupling factor ABC transporter ATP-binding protein [Arenicellales bacterium]|jgi:tungstate transport system ATP-binding protein|nr:energy-coupling factor ABC transporter ATP-binding protein [Acidiferrobacteraceae bacterium]MDP6290189.1 energy-coupling factor ABC transporter ATP-binding protein [Arenicellales bacterium]MDP6435511.1 energy-coupling factor ABC transporter ATP-binding protein [Arenicellales bacterium]MDP6672210.1 energy-coupling factor ABC transporter ATP-binding protein [Arenicellales bacterium]MDP6723756.1 energy-coupling factor ABC transporter ATP-binding protein [Arenicellales bacterium]|tara:strand:+ start:82558 stop:83220 length:663 start_codon:yes stop_codon:yes gene_type:complete